MQASKPADAITEKGAAAVLEVLSHAVDVNGGKIDSTGALAATVVAEVERARRQAAKAADSADDAIAGLWQYAA